MTHQVFCQLLPLYNFFFFYYICNLHLFIWKADVILWPCHGGEVLLWNANEALIERYSWKGRSVRQWSRRSRVPGGALSAAIWSRVMYHWTTTRAARGCSRTHAVRIVTSVALTTFTSRRTCCFLAPFNPSQTEDTRLFCVCHQGALWSPQIIRRKIKKCNCLI